ncbi:MAG: hypothetical protein IPF59_12660 [Ignavibacteria bacterium]|nr:hypothetical protein [Ignavibacteria bacterium]MBK6418310.1 hypothetical protein [Ignavibacteria bacterium]MBK7412321.1 hypothetical protein [Ignavibacteria bacterium]
MGISHNAISWLGQNSMYAGSWMFVMELIFGWPIGSRCVQPNDGGIRPIDPIAHETAGAGHTTTEWIAPLRRRTTT